MVFDVRSYEVVPTVRSADVFEAKIQLDRSLSRRSSGNSNIALNLSYTFAKIYAYSYHQRGVTYRVLFRASKTQRERMIEIATRISQRVFALREGVDS